jgi:hypothetical protein
MKREFAVFSEAEIDAIRDNIGLDLINSDSLKEKRRLTATTIAINPPIAYFFTCLCSLSKNATRRSVSVVPATRPTGERG